GDEVGDMDAAVGNHGEGSLVVVWAGAVCAHDHQLAVVNDVGVQSNDRVVLGQAAEEADPAPGSHHAQRLLLGRTRCSSSDYHVRTAAVGQLEHSVDRVGLT